MGKLSHLLFGLFLISTVLYASPYDINNDDDGLSVELEAVLMTDPFRTDTDLDGFSDSEELARHADPMNALFVPEGEQASMYATAEHRRGWLRITAIAYLPAGKIQARLKFHLYALDNDKLVELNEAPLANLRTQIVNIAAADGHSRLMIVSGEIADDWIYTAKQQTYVVAGEVNEKNIMAASTVLAVNHDVVYWYRTMYFRDVEMGAANAAHNQDGCMSRMESATVVASDQLMAQSREGSIYFPLDPIPHEPSDNVRDSICMQRTSTVGVQGASIINEIVSAACESNWDGYCNPSECRSQVGSTYKTVDPLVLLGG